MGTLMNTWEELITLANKIYLFPSFLTDFYYLMLYRLLTTECGKIFTLPALSFASHSVKDIYYKGSLNMVENLNESLSQTFHEKINT